jgi:hypothetical protein
MIGNEAKASDLADECGCKWVAPRAGDGAVNDGAFALADIKAYQRSGKKVYPWIYSRPRSWRWEIDSFARLMDAGADGVIIDAESDWEGHAIDAQWYMDGLRKRLPYAWIADAPWPWILGHPYFPEKEFAAGVDARLIQDYWAEINRDGAKEVTERAEEQWRQRYAEPGRTAKRAPVYPIACTYGRQELVASGAPPCPGDMTASDLEWFLDAHDGMPISIYSLEMLLAPTDNARAIRAMLGARAQRSARGAAEPFGPGAAVTDAPVTAGALPFRA